MDPCKEQTPDRERLLRADADYVLPTYARSPVVLVRGEGATAWDLDGKAYLDFTSGIGVNSLGYCHPAWVSSVCAQAQTLQHTCNLYYNLPYIELARTLCTRTGLAKVFFANSGAEANEGAIKAARKYAADRYGPQRSTIVTLQNSFHGRTLATLAATGQPEFHSDFGPLPQGFRYAAANDLDALHVALDDTVCAVLIELVQGEGGVIALDRGYVQALAALCAERDLVLIVDEVQTGIGRTGTLFAFEQYKIHPDIVTSAKGLGGGLPIGAILLSQKVAAPMGPGSHGSTFGANPVACAAANAVLGQIDDAFLAQVRKKAAYLRAKLTGLPHVQEVSGLGLLLGLAFDRPDITPGVVRTLCEQQGLLTLTAKSRLRLLPPLIVTDADIDKGVDILRGVLKSF